MDHDQLPEPVGEIILEPIPLNPRQEDLCARLDDLHIQYNLKAKPSEMFSGAMFAMRRECSSNIDWVAQAANSLREILYPIWSKDVVAVTEKKGAALERYGSVSVSEEITKEIDRVYGLLNDLTHHGCNPRYLKKEFSAFTSADFDVLLADFEKVMTDVLERQPDVHDKIDTIHTMLAAESS